MEVNFIKTMLFVTLIVYFIGLWGFIFVKNNLFSILISFEIALFALSLAFVILGAMFDNILGQIMYIYILTIAAAESAMGLAIIILYYRLIGTLELDYITVLKA